MTRLTQSDVDACQRIAAPSRRPMARVVEEVASHTGITSREIMGRGRTARVALARQMVMYILYREGEKLESIGAFLQRDHTTVSHGVWAERRRRGEA